MKTKYYTKLLLPLCLFCALFRFLELAFAVEYSVDSYFYVSRSIIPVIFNLFIGLCAAFFFSFWLIHKVKAATSSAAKEKKEEIKAIKAEGKEAYKAYVNENKKDIELHSDFGRMKKLDAKTTLLYVVASILLLAFSAQLLLDELGSNAVTYTGIGDLFKTFIPYIFIAAVLSVLFFVQFSASPKATAKGKFWMVLSFAPALFYTLLVFYTFQLHSGIISKVFVAFDFLKIAALAIALVSIPQLFISSDHKGIFFSSSLAAVFLSTIRFTDGVVSMLVAMGFGDSILPVISHLDKIDVDPLLAAGDFCLSIALLLTAVRLCKKPKKRKTVKESVKEEPAPVEEEIAKETPVEESYGDVPAEIPAEAHEEISAEITEETPAEETDEGKAEDLAIETEALESAEEESTDAGDEDAEPQEDEEDRDNTAE